MSRSIEAFLTRITRTELDSAMEQLAAMPAVQHERARAAEAVNAIKQPLLEDLGLLLQRIRDDKAGFWVTGQEFFDLPIIKKHQADYRLGIQGSEEKPSLYLTVRPLAESGATVQTYRFDFRSQEGSMELLRCIDETKRQEIFNSRVNVNDPLNERAWERMAQLRWFIKEFVVHVKPYMAQEYTTASSSIKQAVAT